MIAVSLDDSTGDHDELNILAAQEARGGVRRAAVPVGMVLRPWAVLADGEQPTGSQHCCSSPRRRAAPGQALVRGSGQSSRSLAMMPRVWRRIRTGRSCLSRNEKGIGLVEV